MFQQIVLIATIAIGFAIGYVLPLFTEEEMKQGKKFCGSAVRISFYYCGGLASRRLSTKNCFCLPLFILPHNLPARGDNRSSRIYVRIAGGDFV
ncbi:hypothetical protein J4207_02790 [Candidatus Woesearchaeota archaeon]|nr:hypothetical protein [Candidatus Woesearchaeota archaeon]